MKDGKKSIAEQILYGALDIVKQRGNDAPLELFGDALRNEFEHGRRHGGPIPVGTHAVRQGVLSSPRPWSTS